MSGASLLERLGEHLKAERVLHQHLLSLAEKKRDEIVAGNIDAFSKALEQEQDILKKGQELGRRRLKLLEACAKGMNCPVSNLRMAQILERAPEPLRSELGGLSHDLRELLQRLRDLNERNLVLIRQSLGFVREVMNIITGEEQQRQDYSRSGVQDSRQSSGGAILSRKA